MKKNTFWAFLLMAALCVACGDPAADADLPLRIPFEKYTLELARITDVLLRRHGKAIVEKQFALQRAADVVIDLFVGLSVLSRVSSMDSDDDEQYQQALSVAHMFSQQAKRRMNHNLRAMHRNEDESAKSLADFIFDREKYPWDVL